jgi:hypothetical protein
MELTWANGADKLSLTFSLSNPDFTITSTSAAGEQSYSGVEALAKY